jgi:outer membrane lipoprotein-sorting protein
MDVWIEKGIALYDEEIVFSDKAFFLKCSRPWMTEETRQQDTSGLLREAVIGFLFRCINAENGYRRVRRFIVGTKIKLLFALAAGCFLLFAGNIAMAAPNATALIKAALHNWRGDSSYTEVTMTIHRPEWQRSMVMAAWTRSDADSLVRFTKPPGDAGNATLKLGQSLWLYNPKLSQVIQIPFSMMTQNWMGSDFSYNDFAKSDQVVTDYSHSFGPTEEGAGRKIYVVVCLPKPGAPIVWGKQVLKIRDDYVLIEETFYDQDMKPVRRLETVKVAPLGGRPYPVVMRMSTLDKPGRWTEMRYTKGTFDLALPGYLFTLSNLRNPRYWSSP